MHSHCTHQPPFAQGTPSPFGRKCTTALRYGPASFFLKKLSDNAVMPKKNFSNAAGYDLSSAVDTVVPANDKALVPTDIAIALPNGWYGRIAPRSRLAAKHHLAVGAGVIDGDFRGKVKVVLFNHGSLDFHATKGDRIAQLLLERIASPPVMLVTELPETSRGAKGFGSSGLNMAETTPAVDTAMANEADRSKL